MPLIGILFGAVMSALFMWVIWGNGKEVIDYWLDQRAEKSKAKNDAALSQAAREKAQLAPLRSMNDPRELALTLLTGLALQRGDLTIEQSALLARFARETFGYDKPDPHLTLAAFAARGVNAPRKLIDTVTAELRDRLDGTEVADLFRMLDDMAALHGGPNDAQAEFIERCRSRIA